MKYNLPQDARILQNIHLYASKALFGFRTFTTNSMDFSDLEWIPRHLEIRSYSSYSKGTHHTAQMLFKSLESFRISESQLVDVDTKESVVSASMEHFPIKVQVARATPAQSMKGN